VIERVPLTAYDRSQDQRQRERYWVDLAFNLSTTFQHGGFAHFDNSTYRITSAARAALAENLLLNELFSKGAAAYHAWNAARTEQVESIAADRHRRSFTPAMLQLTRSVTGQFGGQRDSRTTERGK
jgi:hypothetical protein